MNICYLAIGSNLGNRKASLNKALREIKKLKQTKIIKISRIIQTKPAGGPAKQGLFLNAALKIRTNIPPFRLLNNIKKIENTIGRKKTVRWGPRVIDIDILLYNDLTMRTKALEIPHPRMFKRDFVLKPLLEVI